jgi:predicted homoserine dehydrogenase-like protein
VIIVDQALRAREAQGKPIHMGMIGAGFMGRGVANQVVNHVPGMRMSAIYARRVEQALSAYTYATPGCEPVVASTQEALDRAIEQGRPVVTDDPFLLCRSPRLDALMDVTGAIELGTQVALATFDAGKHLVLMNAELDATLGPMLAVHAARRGVVLSTCDGDQPAVQINLFRFVRGLGLVPRVMGNVKGLQDRFRTPITQRAFAEKWGQKPEMVTAFADGSKVNFEETIVANATGLTVAKRGMLGYDHAGHIDELTTRYDLDLLRACGGIVEYVVGATPGPAVFCLAEQPDQRQHHYLNLYKLGEGPLYSFYTPYHLCHFEAPNSIARAVLFGDSAGTPLGGPLVEVCAVAKRDLQVGEVLDGYGHFMTYGEAVAVAERRAGRYLPMGLVEGCRLVRPVLREQVLTYDDVALPPGRIADRLYAEQERHFATPEGRS